jgi:hypothetical protein
LIELTLAAGIGQNFNRKLNRAGGAKSGFVRESSQPPIFVEKWQADMDSNHE